MFVGPQIEPIGGNIMAHASTTMYVLLLYSTKMFVVTHKRHLKQF